MIVAETENPEMVKRSIDSVKDYVDGIYITITYKENEPKDLPLFDLFKSYNATVTTFKWINSFADARNFAMEQIPKAKEHIIYWQDADDVLQNAQFLPQIAEEMIKLNHAAIFFRYYYMVELDEQGNVREVLIEHKRERLIRHDGTFKWIGKLHETLINQRQENVGKFFRPECIVVHLTTTERIDENIERNVKILELQAAEEQHKDPRTLHYLAKAYADKAKMTEKEADRNNYFDMAFLLFQEYLEGSGRPGQAGYTEGSGWPEERASAWSYIAEIGRITNKFNIAIRALFNATIEDPTNPIHYVDLAMTYAMMKDFPKAKHWLLLATSVPEQESTLMKTPRDLKAKALEVDFNIALAEGNLEHAIEDAKMLRDIFPNVENVKERLIMAEDLFETNRAAQSIVFLGKYLEKRKENEKLPYLVQSIPKDLEQEKFASEMRNTFFPPRVWEKNEIAIICGPGFEIWSPKSIETGVGGSETAVIHLSQELTKLGWKVTVYANPGQDTGDHDGVQYRMWHELNLRDRFNVLILWRSIGLVDYNLQARFKLVWLHDLPQNPDFTEERVNKVDRIAVLTEYHKSLLRLNKGDEFIPMPDDKVFLTTNGINFLPVKKDIKRNPYRMIWTSSYDRGIVTLLTHWKTIKEAVPEAELHIFYGWNLYIALHANNPARMRWKQQVVEMMKQDGITEHGRIGHKQLAEEFAKSGIWAYPSDFSGEISTISAMEAQAYGAIPVVVDRYSLSETTKNGIKVDCDIQTTEGQKQYIEALISLLKDPKKQEEIRGSMMEWASDYFSWAKVAYQWSSLLSYLKDAK